MECYVDCENCVLTKVFEKYSDYAFDLDVEKLCKRVMKLKIHIEKHTYDNVIKQELCDAIRDKLMEKQEENISDMLSKFSMTDLVSELVSHVYDLLGHMCYKYERNFNNIGDVDIEIP
jgi:hypothetical protein